tara:strand:- start:15 stop:449 length:435 start_codon:yes stop_codon:yes gene_type:complete
MTYDVGDIIYMLSKKNHKIVPARVDSVTTIKKSTGVEVSHELIIPGHSGPAITLERLDVEVFSDSVQLQQHMLEMLTQEVGKQIHDAQRIVSSTWPTESEAVTTADSKKKEQPPLNLDTQSKDPVKVTLPDGTTANIHLPEGMM